MFGQLLLVSFIYSGIGFVITKGRKRIPLAFGEVKWGKGGLQGARKLIENASGLDIDLILVSKEDVKFDKISTYTPDRFLKKVR